MPSVSKTTVVIIHPEPIVRCGLVAIINAHEALRIAGETGALREARDLCARVKPGVIILDPAMEGGEGLRLLRDLPKWAPKAKAVAFTGHAEAADVQQAFEAGVSAYLTKDDGVETVLAAVVGAAAGERHFGPGVERILIERLSAGAIEMRSSLEQALSNREMQIFRLVGAGRAAREVAETLGVSVKTVESHQQRMKQKLRLRSGAELRQRAACFFSGA